MRRGVLIAIGCAWMLLFGIGVPRLRRTGVPVAGAIRLDQHVWDFGSVDDDQISLSQRFLLTNIGAEPLEPRIVSQTCGCVVSDLAAARVASGAGASFRVTVDLQGRQGRFAESLTIGSATGSCRPITLSIVGRVRRRPQVSPAMLDFGEIAPGATAERAITLSPGDDDRPLSVVGIDCPDPAVRWLVECPPPPATQPQDVSIHVELSGRSQPGLCTTALTLLTTHPRLARVVVPVRAKFIGRFSLQPTALFIWDARPGRPSERTITLKSNTGEAFAISMPTSPGLELLATPPFGTAAQTHSVVVRFMPADAGVVRRSLDIVISGAESTTLTLPMVALAQSDGSASR